MVHIVGLERIAEELMGRRKWKLYQGSMSRNYLQPLNNNVQLKANQEEYNKDYSESDSEQCENKIQSVKDSFTTQLSNDDEKVVVKQEVVNGAEEKKANATPEPQDWKPQDNCYFCVDGKLDSEQNSQGVLSPHHSETESSDSHSDNDTPASLTPTFKQNNNHRPPTHPSLPPNMTTIESMAALAVAAFSGNTSPGTSGPHISPFYSSMLSQNWYLANVAARTFQNERLNVSDVPKSGGEQPLDLSKGSANSEKIANNVRLPTLDTKHIFNSDFRAKPRMSTVAGRRTYTEDELQAALRDIQSGKLGTRRAAVIYGIPRSTLRNKVYKLALERERESHLNSTAALKLDEEETMDDDKELSGAEEEKEVEKTLEAPLSLVDLMRISKMETVPETLRTMLLQKTKENQAWTGGEQNDISLLQSMILAHKGDAGALNHLEIIKHMLTEEHLSKLQKLNGDSDKRSYSDDKNDRPKSESDMDTEGSSSSVILKIPSFKPTSSGRNGSDYSLEGTMVSPPVTSESNSPPIIPNKMSIKDVKDVIAQSISQKFQQPIIEPIRRPIMEMDFKNTNFTPPLGSGISVIKTNPQESSRVFQSSNSKPQQQNNCGTPTTGGKGTRPKRGKYRNYDRDSLVEAVRAVQRGEMSVHRAGSYYGVPHSTLEYKVKERHLMRPRKRDPKPNPVDEKIASLKQNDLRNAQEKMKPVIMKPPQKFPPTSPNGMKLSMFEGGMSALPGYNAPPFPFWHPGFHPIPLDYVRNPQAAFPPTPEFFASQMQKLQEESSRNLNDLGQHSTTPTLAKSARQMAESLLDGTGSNGSFLDGIIRSSLESGVPVNDDKIIKEEKNISPENMSNKALLEQLCRNSRLTPLSKSVMGDSSGDESYRKGSSPLNFISGVTIKEEKPNDSPNHIPTIELCNSNDSQQHEDDEMSNKEEVKPRIYLKQDLANPDNLKPEMLVRFIPEQDRNGICENPDSASENDATQD